ncbi:hypothetical protein JXQ31_09700 [candidate division KSB1 bacterium]|nr:hypothetical protein [candidate division KSB1 bacterium]
MRESKLWVYHLIAGAVILVLLGIHMFIMHLDAILYSLGVGSQNPIDSGVVFARSKELFFMITYIILLGTALYHGLYGFKNILMELTLAQKSEKFISGFLTLCGVLLFAYGTFAAVFVFMK